MAWSEYITTKKPKILDEGIGRYFGIGENAGAAPEQMADGPQGIMDIRPGEVHSNKMQDRDELNGVHQDLDMRTVHHRLWATRAGVTCAVILIAVGSAALAGWFFHIPLLIQFGSELPPMTRNAAACSLLCGLAILMMTLKGPRWLTFACSGLVLTASIITIIEYVFDVGLGIDDLLGPSYIPIRVSSPGRMAPVAAICFALGAIVLMPARRFFSKRYSMLVGLAGSIVTAGGLATCMGFVLGSSDAFGWGHDTRMSLPAAIALCFFGFGMLSLTWQLEPNRITAPRLLPVSGTIIVATSATGLWQGLIAAGYSPFALVPAVVLGGGCLMAALLGSTVYMAQHASGQAGALRQSEARKAGILDAALDCIITMDHEGCITEFNRAAERTFGYGRDEVMGRQLADVIIPPPLREQHRAGLERYLGTGEERVLGRRIELTAVRADGSEFPVELAITRIQTDGPPLFTGYLRDITQRKSSLERLQANQELLDLARSELTRVSRITSLGALTASIAHEVSQPLSGIITNASTCLRMLGSETPNIEGAQETARRIIRDGNRASDVITHLRSLFAKNEVAGVSINLNEVAEEVIALSRTELQRNAIVLRQEFSEKLPIVIGDRVQLQQVILNLLLNASHAMNDVDDRSRELVIGTADESGNVLLTVRDTGVGFALEDEARLFDAFYTTKKSGMGIGLHVSLSIIERHNGRLWASLNDGPGATFSFSIPHSTDQPGPPDSSTDRG